jgi:hypothetical protein
MVSGVAGATRVLGTASLAMVVFLLSVGLQHASAAAAPEGSAAARQQAAPTATRLSGFSKARATVRVGGEVTNTVTVLPRAARTVTGQSKRASTTRFTKASGGKASPQGQFEARLTPHAAGVWEFRLVVTATSRAKALVSPIRTVTASGKASTTSINGFASASARVTVGGVVHNVVTVLPKASRTVEVQTRQAGAKAFVVATTGKSSSSGVFGAVYRPTHAGVWQYRLVVRASRTARSATSPPRSVTADPPVVTPPVVTPPVVIPPVVIPPVVIPPVVIPPVVIPPVVIPPVVIPPVAGSVSGVVTSASDGKPVGGVDVEAIATDPMGQDVHATTAADGTYAIPGLNAGTYSVCVTTASGFVSQCYPNVPLDGATPPTPVTVANGQATAHVDAVLQDAGSVSGTAVSASTSVGLPGVDVEVTSDSVTGSATTATDGTYTVDGLLAGSYTVCYYPPAPTTSGIRYVGQCYQNEPLGGATQNPVTITAGQLTAGINTALTAQGGISGRVTSAADSNGLSDVEVEATLASGTGPTVFATTGPGGTYTMPGLASEQYNVCFFPPSGNAAGFVPQCYNNQPADGSGTLDPIAVTAGQITAGIDAQLASSGSISGTVTSGGSPVSGVDVQAVPITGSGAQADVITAADGTYSVPGVAAGTYSVCFYPISALNGPLPQCYNTEPAAGSLPPDPVTVTGGSTTSGIDAALIVGGSISGIVTGSTQIAAAEIELTATDGSTTLYASTAPDGTYTATGLAAGDYTACVFPTIGSGTGFRPLCYNNQPVDGTPDPVTVTAGTTTSHVDVALPSAAAISGTVTSAADDSPLAGVEVDAFPLGAGSQQTMTTASDGTYTLPGLAPDGYWVCFYPGSGYTAQCYTNQPADGTGSPDQVDVIAGTVTSGINAAMQTGL